MKNTISQLLRAMPLLLALPFTLHLPAADAPIQVRHINGTMHGFLQLRNESGHVVASGDLIQTSAGSKITAHLVFHFTDGSLDDETTVFTQRHNFQLVSDHHIQKGPSFPHPLDMMVDARTGVVTVRSTDKDGKEDVKTHHLHLPANLANGLVSYVLENSPAGAEEIKAAMVVATPSPRLVTLNITSHGEESFSVAGTGRKATHYEIKIDLGGVAGMVAPIIGKQPPNIQIWILGGPAPTFLREQGQLYADGPIMTMELVSPTWPSDSKSGQ